MPEVSKGMTLANDPEKCGFVLTVQWLLLIFYLYVFFVMYFPFSKIMRVTVHKWYSLHPRQPFSNARGLGALVSAILIILGDFGVIGVPTPYNGGLFYHVSGADLVLSIVNSPVLFPIFAWFTVIFQVVIYWSVLYIIANYRLVFYGLSLDA
ncbi:MAG: hypothetical protein WC617_17180 [Rhodanobacter sp.]